MTDDPCASNNITKDARTPNITPTCNIHSKHTCYNGTIHELRHARTFTWVCIIEPYATSLSQTHTHNIPYNTRSTTCVTHNEHEHTKFDNKHTCVTRDKCNHANMTRNNTRATCDHTRKTNDHTTHTCDINQHILATYGSCATLDQNTQTTCTKLKWAPVPNATTTYLQRTSTA